MSNTRHQDFMEECAAQSIQAAVRGYFVREWFYGDWNDSDDDENCITTADLLRLTAGRIPPSFQYSLSDRGEIAQRTCILLMQENGAPRRVSKCPCCDSTDLIVRGFFGGGVKDDENVYCNSCGEYLGIEL
jgi:hypothetical protein